MPSHDDLDEQLADFERAENRRLLSEHKSKWQAKVASHVASSSVFRPELEGAPFIMLFAIAFSVVVPVILFTEGFVVAGVIVVVAQAVVIALAGWCYLSVMFWKDRWRELIEPD